MNLVDEGWSRICWPLEPANVGCRLKEQPEDFRVDEVAAYEPCGHGDFVFLRVEKRDVASDFFVRVLAERLNVKPAAIGMAGRKDRRAVTSQWISVAARDLEQTIRPSAIDGPVGESGHVRLLNVSRHTNKLRTGHLRGNHFTIRLRPIPGEATPTAEQLQERMKAASERGFPNLFGPQRFSRGKTVAMGLAAIGGKRISNVRRLKLAISAVQALVFNRWLALRQADGNLDTALLGDVLKRRDSGGMFVSDDPDVDSTRIRSGELVVTGALPGNKFLAAQSAAATYELAALRSLNLGDHPFAAFGKRATGTRRAALIFPSDVSVQAVGGQTQGAVTDVRFFLPKGAYATVLLRAVAGAVAQEGPGVKT